MRALFLAVALMVASSTPAEARGSKKSSSSSKKAPVCKKGKACGNSCIAKSAVCHQEKGTATNADEKSDSAADAPQKQK